MQFTRLFAIVALASVGFVAADVSGGLIGDLPAEAESYIKELTQSHAASRSLDGRGVKPVERGSTGDCSVGAPQCCNQVINDSQKKKTLAGLLGLNDVVGQIGLNCANIPVNVIGAAVDASNYCKSSPVCCTNVTQNGLVNLGCTSLPLN